MQFKRLVMASVCALALQGARLRRLPTMSMLTCRC